MGHIIPKLNLNKTPQAVDSNSLVFAKNIKVNQDGSLGRDNAISLIRDLSTVGIFPGEDKTAEYLGHIVGINGCIYFFVRTTNNATNTYNDFIYEYDEINLNNNGDPKFTVIPCGWHWSGGTITGCVTTNNTNQKILTVSEYFDDNENNVLVPLKHINLSECKNNDDESIYTQNPNIPIINLNLVEYYSASIPKGVYQFFIRYEIRDEFYTNWFPASKELYAWDTVITSTIQGVLTYNNIDRDCGKSFVLEVEHLFKDYNKLYKSFQIGFILSSNNSVVGRSWKSFKMNTNKIYFDYDNSFIEEVLIDDFLKYPIEVYNSKNVVSYKNKLYISNYIENDFNPKLQYLTNNITVDVEKLNVDYDPLETYNYLGDGILSKSNDDLSYFDKVDDKYIRNFVGDSNKFKLNYDEEIIQHIHNIHVVGTEESQSVYIHLRDLFIRDNYQVCGIYFEGKDANNNTVLLRGTGINQETLNDYFTWFLTESSSTIDSNYTVFWNKFISLTYNNDRSTNYITISRDEFDKEYELNNFLKYIIRGVKLNNNIVVDIRGTEYTLTKIYVDLIYVTRLDSVISDYGGYDVTAYIQYSRYTLTTQPGIISTTATQNINNQMNTLLPFCEYDVYVHFVKQNGITTNGYLVKHLSKDDTKLTEISAIGKYMVLYPKITISGIFPEDYVACLFTILQTKNNISQIVKVDTDLYDCIDLDCLLYSTNVPLDILKLSDGSIVYENGIYYGSNDVYPSESIFLGNSGIVKTDSISGNTNFILHNYECNSGNINSLIKLTPYIKLTSGVYDNYSILNIPGFISRCSKLDFDKTNNDIFVSGLDVFDKDDTDKLKLTECNSFVDVTEINNSVFNYIYSRYNLSCLTLRENLNKGIRTWNKQTETVTDSTGSTTTETLEQQWIVSVNSQNCSLIYDLPLMYKEYTRKYYSVVDNKTFTVFDNTVRSSNVDVDEIFRSIYRFDAEDYYNVPTNRGIIVNLFSINNEIFVHTEHGLFKFTDSSLLKVGDNLYSSNKEVGVAESSPFDIGIAEIVDSQYGHGGLQNKEHALITFNGYIFYDSLVRTIYSYDNQSGIQNITPPVRKIIDWFEPIDVTFVSDDANNRFFITLSKVVTETIDGVPTDVKQVICLSYSFISNSFVSIHDIDYTYAFNSRLNTYFIQGSNFLKVNYKDFGSYVNKYPSVLTIRDEATYNEDSVGSCIDIIINDGYEAIKALSHIHWICSSINDYVGENPYNVAEELITEYGGDSIRVYSDQTWSDLLPIATEQNTQQINSANSYQYPRYNNGIWTMNYFRDIKNANSNYISDDMALIHGKYIVVRFIFGANKKNFKFENLNINFENYEKV